MGNTNQRHGGNNRIEMASDESSPAINGNDLRIGDHVYTWRAEGSFGHHGIFVDKGLIIEYNTGEPSLIVSGSIVSQGSGVVTMCSWKSFQGEGSLYRYEYGVSEQEFKNRRAGTCTTAKSDDAETVKQRAEYLLANGYGRYHLLNHNCEDFALYCKTGLVVPGGRGSSGQAGPLANISNNVGLGASSQCSSRTGDFREEFRYCLDIGVRPDARKMELEELINPPRSTPSVAPLPSP